MRFKLNTGKVVSFNGGMLACGAVGCAGTEDAGNCEVLGWLFDCSWIHRRSLRRAPILNPSSFRQASSASWNVSMVISSSATKQTMVSMHFHFTHTNNICYHYQGVICNQANSFIVVKQTIVDFLQQYSEIYCHTIEIAMKCHARLPAFIAYLRWNYT